MIRQFIDMMSKYSDSDQVLIYQMGKVGSSSIEACLDKAINVHTLYGNSTCPPLFDLRKRGLKGWIRYSMPFFFKRRALKKRKQLDIVCLVREPVSRNRSMYFQDLYHWLSSYVRVKEANGKSDGLDLLIDCYREFFNHDYYGSWFDRELKRFTGIDIFQHPFTPGQMQTIESGNIRLCLLRLEDLSDNWQDLEAFLQRKLVRTDSNVAEKKWYGSLYKEFLAACPTLPVENALYDLKTAKHFGYEVKVQ